MRLGINGWCLSVPRTGLPLYPRNRIRRRDHLSIRVFTERMRGIRCPLVTGNEDAIPRDTMRIVLPSPARRPVRETLGPGPQTVVVTRDQRRYRALPRRTARRLTGAARCSRNRGAHDTMAARGDAASA